ncbi:hypothetical protein ACFZAG_17950 [Streptomyces sp. NPDC012403]|uniref:hypothetical protein n=1 Tax=unclassified Streptomyces TaxID=2593676 RepID=UPI001C247A35|nr:hypothetical protein [Streptomyces sp. AC558_RSS880]
MDLSWFQSQTAQQLRAEGRAEDVLLLLDHRRIEVSGQERERVMDCGDPGTLEIWFTRAITATSAAEVFEDAAG